MMRSTLSVLLVVSFAATSALAQPAPAQLEEAAKKPTVALLSLNIAHPMPEAVEDLPLYSREGTQMTLLIAAPGKFIIGLDEEASKLASFTDDKKTDLSKAKARSWNRGRPDWLSAFGMNISKDGQYCTVEARSEQTPAPGAKAIRLDATIVLKCGADLASAEQKSLPLKKDQNVSAGPIRMKITEVETGPGFSGDEETSVTFQTDTSLDNVKQFVFLDEAGKPIDSRLAGSASWSSDGKAVHEVSYALTGKHEKVDLKIDYFGKIERLAVPVKIDAGVGF